MEKPSFQPTAPRQRIATTYPHRTQAIATCHETHIKGESSATIVGLGTDLIRSSYRLGTVMVGGRNGIDLTNHTGITQQSKMKSRLKYIVLLLLFLGGATTSVSAQEENRIAEAVRGDTASTGFVADLLHWYDANMNYYAVGALMTIESSFIPFPSEVIIPPAVYVAANPETKGGMKIWLIVVVGTLGALLGAFINYYLSRWLGRPIIYAFAESKLGHLLQLSSAKIERAEKYFADHGNISTLVGRLIPVIRQLISIPAGLAKMNLGAFTLFTTLGALIWNCILALLGYLAYQAADPTVIERYSHQLSIAIVVLLILCIAFFVIRHIIKKHRNK